MTPSIIIPYVFYYVPQVSLYKEDSLYLNIRDIEENEFVNISKS